MLIIVFFFACEVRRAAVQQHATRQERGFSVVVVVAYKAKDRRSDVIRFIFIFINLLDGGEVVGRVGDAWGS